LKGEGRREGVRSKGVRSKGVKEYEEKIYIFVFGFGKHWLPLRFV
jgi:hypothetical protein